MKFLKMRMSLAVIFAVLVATMVVCAEDSAMTGSGTQDNPYCISDKSGLEDMAVLIEQGQTAGVYFELADNIQLNAPDSFVYNEGIIASATEGAEKWTGAGTESTPFQGHFDGKGHYITGLYCDNAGLFGVLDGAWVINLNLDFSLVEAEDCSGIIAGKVKGNSLISDCVVSGSVIGKQQEIVSVTGGIAGSLDSNSKIKNCCFYGAVSGPNAFSSNVGGIAGLNYGKIEKCAFGGNAIGVSMYFTANVGGIAGSNQGEIKGCVSQGTVSAESMGEVNDCNAGGIAGYSDGFVSQCRNESNVSAYCASYGDSISTAGGIVGYVKNSDVYGCENKGSVTGVGAYSGGIAGLSVADSGEHKIYDCLNSAEVESEYGVEGGICARISASGYVTDKNEIVSCVNVAAGGVAGMVYSDDSAIVSASDCYYLAGSTDGFEEGSTSKTAEEFTSGSALAGLDNDDVWMFEEGKNPAIVYAGGISKNTSKITAESTQYVADGSTIVAQGEGNMVVSGEITQDVNDVIVRFTGTEQAFAPASVVVKVFCVTDANELEILSVDTSALVVEENKVSGKIKLNIYAPVADMEYIVINSTFVDGTYYSLTTSELTTQKGVSELEFDIASATSIAQNSVVTINTMIVTDTESMSPVCENVVTQA